MALICSECKALLGSNEALGNHCPHCGVGFYTEPPAKPVEVVEVFIVKTGEVGEGFQIKLVTFSEKEARTTARLIMKTYSHTRTWHKQPKAELENEEVRGTTLISWIGDNVDIIRIDKHSVPKSQE